MVGSSLRALVIDIPGNLLQLQPPPIPPKSKSAFGFRYRTVTQANVDVFLPYMQGEEKSDRKDGNNLFLQNVLGY